MCMRMVGVLYLVCRYIYLFLYPAHDVCAYQPAFCIIANRYQKRKQGCRKGNDEIDRQHAVYLCDSGKGGIGSQLDG